jgi:1,1a-dihydroxy-1-hydro-9-fluorenone dehydrogenase
MAVKDKVVLVTGAARGMGREYVRGFLREGAKVIATDLSWTPSGVSNDDFRFDEEIRDNANVLVDVMDISIDSHVRRVYQRALDTFGTVDVIINNAGMRSRILYPTGYPMLIETEVGDWQKLFDTHVFGSLRVIKAFTQPMLEKGRGSIINVSSNGYDGSRPSSREMPYQAAKAALTTMTLYLAHELKPYNIAANVIFPGHTRTTGSDELEAARRERMARGGAPGARGPLRLNPEHMVPVALFLAEQDAEGVTGQLIHAPQWNEEHSLGGVEQWAYERDLADRALSDAHPRP